MGGTINEQFPVGVTKTMVLEGQLRRVTAERDQLRAELEKVRCELDDAEERASEAEERCAAEWEKDCGQALRILAQVTKFEWDQDGSPADEVREHVQITLESLEKQVLSLRAELAAAKERGDGLYLGLRQTLEALGGVAQPGVSEAFLILGVPGEAAAIKQLNVALAAHVERLVGALKPFADRIKQYPPWMWTAMVEREKQGIITGGFRVGGEAVTHMPAMLLVGAEEALAATPAQSLAAHDAATKEPSPFLSRAAWRVVKEVWVDVAAGRMNARSAVADAALDLRGLLEESGPEPADDVVGVERKAETTFGGYLAAHDAAVKVALLREVAETCKFRLNGGEWRICPETLLDEADRIEKEAPHA